MAKETATVMAPIRAPKEPCGYEIVELKILEPFSVVKYMFCEAGLKLDPRTVREFWEHHVSVGSPWVSNSKAAIEKVHIPLGLFGDAAKVRQLSFNKSQKILGIFLNAPLWRPRSCRASRWLIFSIREDLLVKHETLNKIYHHVTWSLNCLYEDKYPSSGPNGEELVGKQKDRAGQAICGGLKFSVTEIRGDWLYHKQVFRFRSSWKGGANLPVCWQCPAMGSGVDRYYHVDASSHALVKTVQLDTIFGPAVAWNRGMCRDNRPVYFVSFAFPVSLT